MKPQIFHVGLVCLMVINPYFLSAQQASAQAPALDSVMLDLDAIYRQAAKRAKKTEPRCRNSASINRAKK